MGKTLKAMHFRALNRQATRGLLIFGHMAFKAACGRSGRGVIKKEGDGLTPIGSFGLEALLYRKDRLIRPRSCLPIKAFQPDWAWCEEVGNRNYNRLVQRPPDSGHDMLTRADHLYDVIVVTSHNQLPRVQNRGSAIFFHLARDGFKPTAGCIAVSGKAMRDILSRCGPGTRLIIH
jgi:L,D-peptidoglycan transpeptidase YkuD (ErfK/YbiS/YcfS/YnhG family)